MTASAAAPDVDRAPLPAEVDVAIVGGGPAGAVTATLLARAGHRVVVLERAPTWRWRAGGVFSSPATLGELRAAGLAAATLAAVARPIPAMRVETAGGVRFRLTYGAENDGGAPPVGFDRSALDPALLELAAAAGAELRRGTAVSGLDLPSGGGPVGVRVATSVASAADSTIRARVVVGADGLRSLVARAVGVARAPRLGARVGLTWHLADAPGDPSRDARMVVLDGAYCGLAPVPGGRVNVGIVLAGRGWRNALATRGAVDVAAEVLRAIPSPSGEPEPWRDLMPTDTMQGAVPLGHRVTRRSGPGWLLVGDAAGFLDPFTGEGLHRALVSARLAAETIDACLRGHARDLHSYERTMRGRFGAKDLVSLMVQAFLARPALFEYAARRLAARERVRATMGLVMGDLVPASRALDPRFLAALLAP